MQSARLAVLAAASAVLVTIVGLSVGVYAPRAAAAAPPAAYEHSVVLLDFEQYKEDKEYKDLEKQHGSPWLAQFAYQELVLTRAGAAGWELVAVAVQKTPAQSVFYLKKAK
jgi:hypothetical protein